MCGVVGYQISVVSVRDGAAGTSPWAGVGRDVSTRASVRTPTP
jgi:hypothetical protein